MGGLKLGKEAQTKYDEARNGADYSGFLEKKGAKRKNWNMRWFVMKDNYLFYSKSPKSNPQGIINLHGCTVVKPEGPNSRQTSFNVLAPKSVSVDAKWTNRLYFFAAKDVKEMEEWINAIESASRKSLEKSKAANGTGGTPASSTSAAAAAATTATPTPPPATPDITTTTNPRESKSPDSESDDEDSSSNEAVVAKESETSPLLERKPSSSTVTTSTTESEQPQQQEQPSEQQQS